jgi:hypothetical protein
MFFRRNNNRVETYDKERLYPAIRSSICTGEKVAGFKNRETGSFTEITLVTSDKDIEDFKNRYGITGEVEVFY